MAREQTVMLVDDDEAYARTIARLLRTEGFRVTTYADATSALQAVAGEAPDIILLDLRLRGGGGISMLQTLRSQERAQTIRVIVTSGDVKQLRESAPRLSALDCEVLIKPFSMDELLDKLREAA